MLDVSHAKKLFAVVGDYAENLVLKVVCVLIFVNKNLPESVGNGFCEGSESRLSVFSDGEQL